MLSDRYREQVLIANAVSDGLHVKNFQELQLIHKFIEGCCPSLTKSLQVFCLLNIYFDVLESIKLKTLLFSEGCLDQRLSNNGSLVSSEQSIINHALDHKVNTLLN